MGRWTNLKRLLAGGNGILEIPVEVRDCRRLAVGTSVPPLGRDVTLACTGWRMTTMHPRIKCTHCCSSNIASEGMCAITRHVISVQVPWPYPKQNGNRCQYLRMFDFAHENEFQELCCLCLQHAVTPEHHNDHKVSLLNIRWASVKRSRF